MITWCLAAVLVLATEPDGNALKGFHVYQDDLRAALRREATATTPGRRTAAIRDLAALYEELSADPRLESSDTLTQMRNKLWSRLTAIQRDLERRIAREADSTNQTSHDYSRQPPGAANGAAEALAARLARVAYEIDGPGALASANEGAFGGGAVVGDWGPALVNLIERTIAPDKWDTVGGPFSIMYYAPLRVLVVRATDEVHHRIGGAVGALRAAGP